MKKKEMEKMYDVIIIGGGPAGLTGAIYLARAHYRVLVMEKERFGGQITISSKVVNYPGILQESGEGLTQAMKKQAENFGAEFLKEEVIKMRNDNEIKIVKSVHGEYSCFGILLATGASPRKLGFDGEEKFKGKGVAYCATCDGEFFTGMEVFVIGGGFAAAEESVFLTKFARNVTILVREEDFTCAKAVAEEARNNQKITVLTNTVVENVSGNSMVNEIHYKNIKTGQHFHYKENEKEGIGVFVFVGYMPKTELVKEMVKLDEQGYVITDANQKTSLEGIYAAGDLCVKPLRQVVTAVGDGAIAATELEKYVLFMHKKTGIHPLVPEHKKEEVEELFQKEMKDKLQQLFNSMQEKVIIKLALDNRSLSKELKEYMLELTKITNQIKIGEELDRREDLPAAYVYRENGQYAGLAFHGVPGGHEFTSFIMGLYNTAGPGQKISEEELQRIRRISFPVSMKILVSLSCTMCPELVMAAQNIAAENHVITAEVYDLNHFKELKDKYHVMSVPCMIINDKKVLFGKRDIDTLLKDIIEMKNK